MKVDISYRAKSELVGRVRDRSGKPGEQRGLEADSPTLKLQGHAQIKNQMVCACLNDEKQHGKKMTNATA